MNSGVRSLTFFQVLETKSNYIHVDPYKAICNFWVFHVSGIALCAIT